MCVLVFRADARAGFIGDDAEGESLRQRGGQRSDVERISAIGGFKAVGVLVAIAVIDGRVGACVRAADKYAGIRFRGVSEPVAVRVRIGGIGGDARCRRGEFRAIFEGIAVAVGEFGIDVRVA